MGKKYFIFDKGKKKGPFEISEIKELNIDRTTLVWTVDNPNWTEAEKLEEMKSYFESMTSWVIEPQTTTNVDLETPSILDYSHLDENSLAKVGGIEYFNNETLKLYSPETGEIITYRFSWFSERLMARIVDGLIIGIPSYIIPFLPPFLYFTLQHSSNNQRTVGQKVMKIKLLSTDGSKITYGQATGRFFANILNVLTFTIGYLLYFTTRKKQCLHDSLANTISVYEMKREKYNI